MTADEFRKAAVALSGKRWSVPDMADTLEVGVRSVQCWASGVATVPADVAANVHELLRQRRTVIDELLCASTVPNRRSSV